MKWVTRRNAHVDRTACPWLIRKFIDPVAEFIFVSSLEDASATGAIPFDMRGVELSHRDGRCTFEVIVEKYSLRGDSALVEMGRVLRDSDVPPSRTRRQEAAGVDALIRGFQLAVPDDQEKLRLTAPLYDALYSYCRAKAATTPANQGAPKPRLRYRRRMQAHLEEDV
ncbi:MAG: chromate resistance protein [Chloroflexi bacterium]|nr:chromate resistance protein [Chloroflexota bacterium]